MESNRPIRVLLTDDHKIIRDGLKAMLASVPEILVVAEAQNGQEAIGWLSSTDIDIVLMDISMPVLDGIGATKLIMEKFPKIKVLALSMHYDEMSITKVVKAGAKGYLMKNAGKDELVNAIHSVMEGNTWFSDDVSQIMLSKYMGENAAGVSLKFPAKIDLTTRETEILSYIAREFTNKEIGDKLFISQRTVDTHRRNLMSKLGVKNTVGLIKYAIAKGLVEDE